MQRDNSVITPYRLTSSCCCSLGLVSLAALKIAFYLNPTRDNTGFWDVDRLRYIVVDFGSTASVVASIVRTACALQSALSFVYYIA
ncbi:hypothetical protein BJ741DRAFT_358907 [Chytriomyces cf. hyalinus JEL632]|nr:hypothetical protein BJ741DRAFT_358907 [Chytriomyces cf. hyalinus JEL632]